MVTLETVDIPGLREAVRREACVRDTAFLDGLELLCGVEVVPLSLRRLIWLEQARNGFVSPYRFDSDAEYLANAVQVVYFCSREYRVPTTPRVSLWAVFFDGMRRHRFFSGVLRYGSAAAITKEVGDWIADAFMDAPGGGGNDAVPGPSYASYPAYVVDKFAQAGLPFTYDEIMDMPLRRLWQHWRIASRRVDEMTLTNPSDEIATRHLAEKKP